MEDKQVSSSCWYNKACNYYPNECNNLCIRYIEMKHLMESSGLPKNKWYPIPLDADEYDYDAYCELANIKKDIENFVNNGLNLYIASRHTGNGKTTWSIKLLQKYFDCVWSGSGFRTRGLFIHVPTLLTQLKNFNNPLSEERKQEILNADLIVWDEVSTISSDFDRNQLLLFLEPRIFNGKSNIFTGNIVDGHDMEKILGSRLKSRIYDNSVIIEFRGLDKRGLNRYGTSTNSSPK